MKNFLNKLFNKKEKVKPFMKLNTTEKEEFLKKEGERFSNDFLDVMEKLSHE